MVLRAAKELTKSTAEQKSDWFPCAGQRHQSEAPVKVAVSICLLQFPAFFSTGLDQKTTPVMMAETRAEALYTFRLSDLPKLDLEVDKGTDFTACHLQKNPTTVCPD